MGEAAVKHEPIPSNNEVPPLGFRTLPQDLGCEMALLGGLMSYNQVAQEITFLRGEHFADPRHGRIYDAILAQLERPGGVADPITLRKYFEHDGSLAELGGPKYLAQLAASMVSEIMLADYARLLVDLHTKRAGIEAAMRAIDAFYNPDADPRDVIALAESDLYAIGSDDHQHSGLITMAQAVQDGMEDLQDAMNRRREGARVGVETGLIDLDSIIGPMLPGDFIVLAGATGMGKTAAAQQIVVRNAQLGVPVLDVTLEMQARQLAMRSISGKTGVAIQAVRSGRVTDTDIGRMLDHGARIAKLPIWLADKPGLTISRLRSHAKRMKRRVGLGLIVVDYIQLMEPEKARKGGSRVEDVTEFTRGLKNLAGELEVPIIGLSQLSRAVDTRDDHRPRKSDLRESGCLAGDTMIYMPDTGRWARIDDLVGSQPSIVAADANRMVVSSTLKVFNSGTKALLRLTTGSGRIIRATASHKFLTPDGWAPLGVIGKGQKIAVPARLPGPTTSTMSDDEAALLGHLIGDGCVLPRHAVQYTTKDEDLASTVIALSQRVFGERLRPRFKLEGSAKRGTSWIQVYLASAQRLTHGRPNAVTEWFSSMGIMGLRSYEKRVPACMFHQSAETIRVFVKHLWATDGTVVVRKRPTRGEGKQKTRRPPADLVSLTYTTASRALADGVHDLLLRLGIKSHVRMISQGAKGRMQYHTVICGLRGNRRFLETVGIAGARKSAVVARALAVLGTGPGLGNTLDGDIYWDAVTSIEEDGVEPVYDITVPDHHNFVANGIVVHNSLEQDADFVILIYRDEYYLRQDGLDGPDRLPGETDKAYTQRLERQERAKGGVTELIVAKNRHGPQDKAMALYDGLTMTFHNKYAGER